MQIRHPGILVVAGISLALIVAVIWHFHHDGRREFIGSEETIRLATLRTALSNLIWIAQQMQFFREQGLSVEISDHEVGLMALSELLEGKADLATVAAFVAVRNFPSHPDLRVITILDEHQETKFVGRKDREITV